MPNRVAYRPPTYRVRGGEGVGNYLAEACRLLELIGQRPDPWQEEILADMLTYNEAGKWVSPTFGLSVPRQNGKTKVANFREIPAAALFGEAVLHTCHEVKSGRQSFVQIAELFGQAPALRDMVRTIRGTNGQEGVYLHGGGKIEWIARSHSSGRGYTADLWVADEAQELTGEQLSALSPTLAAAPLGNPQTLLLGTPPRAGMEGEPFGAIRRAALSDNPPAGVEWVEYSGAGLNPDDPDVWLATNPALGGRVLLDSINAERAAMSPEMFARERLGVWSEVASAAVVDPDVWESLGTEQIPDTEGEIFVGVDISANRRRASIVAVTRQGAGSGRAGVPVIDVIETRGGVVTWIPEYIRQLVDANDIAAIVISAVGAAASLAEPLRDLGITPTVIGSGQAAQSAGMLYDAIEARAVTHLHQRELTAAMQRARRRKTQGGAWVWIPALESDDITPLTAASLAYYGLTAHNRTERATPRRKRKRAVIV